MSPRLAPPLAAALLALSAAPEAAAEGSAQGTAGGATAALPGGAAGPAPDADHAVAAGRRFRVRFEPASRVSIGAGLAAVGRAAPAAAPELSAGVAYRSAWATGRGRERIAWTVDQAFASGYLQPSRRAPNGVPGFDATAYAVTAARHDGQPGIVLPLAPPVALPFPFDLALEAEVGHVAASASVVHVGVARAAVLLDAARWGRAGNVLAVGLAARYDVDLQPGGARPVHRVAPLTAPTVLLRLESDGGLWLLDARGEVAPHWASDGGWRVLGAGSLHAERILAAVNDQPVAATLDGGYRVTPASGQGPAEQDARVSLGLAFHLALR